MGLPVGEAALAPVCALVLRLVLSLGHYTLFQGSFPDLFGAHRWAVGFHLTGSEGRQFFPRRLTTFAVICATASSIVAPPKP